MHLIMGNCMVKSFFIIDKSFFNAKLQGPANRPVNSKKILPLLSTYYWNFDIWSIVNSINQKLKQKPKEPVSEIFGETVLPLKQPLNLLTFFNTVSARFVYL